MYYNSRNNGPFGGGAFRSRYQYQTLPYGFEGVQASGLISKVMGLLAFSFIFASIGAFVGISIGLSYGAYWIVAIAGFVVLIALQFLIQKSGLNLVLLYLFTFLEGLSLSPLLSLYLNWNSNILGEAFLMTAVTSLALAFYAWTTKRDFTRLGDYLFIGVILLLIASLVGIFFHTTLLALIISVVGIAIFAGYVLYYVQRAKYLADTLPNAIGLTVSIFITVLNLFLYILQLLTILQGGNRRD
ncbi:Bax inhibitor-1/YccA family protein [Ktedonosporobacter rubrisoli]|uniref:Bax inhibitor-1/YccA family protein n=1 Tax=Ktedonosporobacter rubrisoli TaxID=2509675 RepID=A0A4P6K200_KTERU|nr:Bax inhibitor-1/YccA family protein [Ktedonosporobacter rubrisoli]QBD81912.1 Bax inhibitor-1/YccA family protein [Ktedonosporobacter rubrisoli]